MAQHDIEKGFNPNSKKAIEEKRSIQEILNSGDADRNDHESTNAFVGRTLDAQTTRTSQADLSAIPTTQPQKNIGRFQKVKNFFGNLFVPTTKKTEEIELENLSLRDSSKKIASASNENTSFSSRVSSFFVSKDGERKEDLEKTLDEISDVEKFGINYFLKRYPHNISTGSTLSHGVGMINVGDTPSETLGGMKAGLSIKKIALKPMVQNEDFSKPSTWEVISRYYKILFIMCYIMPNAAIDEKYEDKKGVLSGIAKYWQKFWIVGVAGTLRFGIGILESFVRIPNIFFKFFSRFTIAFVTSEKELEGRATLDGEKIPENYLYRTSTFLKWWKERAPLEFLTSTEYKNAKGFKKMGMWIIKAPITTILSIPIHIINIFLLGTIKLILDRAAFLISYAAQILIAPFELIAALDLRQVERVFEKVSNALTRMAPELFATAVGVSMFFAGFALPAVVAAAAFAGLTFVISGAIVARFGNKELNRLARLYDKEIADQNPTIEQQVEINHLKKTLRVQVIKGILVSLAIVAAIAIPVILTSGLSAFALPFALLPGALSGGGGFTALGLWLSMGALGVYSWCAQKFSAVVGTDKKVSLNQELQNTKDEQNPSRKKERKDASKSSKGSKKKDEKSKSSSSVRSYKTQTKAETGEKSDEEGIELTSLKSSADQSNLDEPATSLRQQSRVSVTLKRDGKVEKVQSSNLSGLPDEKEFNQPPAQLGMLVEEPEVQNMPSLELDSVKDNKEAEVSASSEETSPLVAAESVLTLERGTAPEERASAAETNLLVSSKSTTSAATSLSAAASVVGLQAEHQRLERRTTQPYVGQVQENRERYESMLSSHKE